MHLIQPIINSLIIIAKGFLGVIYLIIKFLLGIIGISI